jgi:hypothetical protein
MSNESQADPAQAAYAHHNKIIYDGAPGKGFHQVNQPPLNAAQIEAIRKQMIAEFQKAVDDVEMRKQAVDAACKILPHIIHNSDPIALVREVYAFMAEPAAEIVVKIT